MVIIIIAPYTIKPQHETDGGEISTWSTAADPGVASVKQCVVINNYLSIATSNGHSYLVID